VEARVEKIPALANVSTKLPEDEQKAFRQKKRELEAAYKEFKTASDRFNVKPAEDQSDAEYEALQARRGKYIQDAIKFNESVAVAVDRGRKEPDEAVIPVSIFAMPEEGELCRRQLAILTSQMSFLNAQRDQLKKTESGIRQLVIENVTASRDLLQDTQSQVLTVMGGMLSMMNLPAGTRDALGTALGGAQWHLSQRAALTAADERRAREKMIEAAGELKNLLLSIPRILPGAEGEATKSATDGVLKIFKIIDRHSTPELGPADIRADLEDAVNASFDVVQAVDPVMERALKQNATALSYYDNRIAKVVKDIAFYEQRLAILPKGAVSPPVTGSTPKPLRTGNP
jgi:hypothetical protein